MKSSAKNVPKLVSVIVVIVLIASIGGLTYNYYYDMDHSHLGILVDVNYKIVKTTFGEKVIFDFAAKTNSTNSLTKFTFNDTHGIYGLVLAYDGNGTSNNATNDCNFTIIHYYLSNSHMFDSVAWNETVLNASYRNFTSSPSFDIYKYGYFPAPYGNYSIVINNVMAKNIKNANNSAYQILSITNNSLCFNP